MQNFSDFNFASLQLDTRLQDNRVRKNNKINRTSAS